MQSSKVPGFRVSAFLGPEFTLTRYIQPISVSDGAKPACVNLSSDSDNSPAIISNEDNHQNKSSAGVSSFQIVESLEPEDAYNAIDPTPTSTASTNLHLNETRTCTVIDSKATKAIVSAKKFPKDGEEEREEMAIRYRELQKWVDNLSFNLLSARREADEERARRLTLEAELLAARTHTPLPPLRVTRNGSDKLYFPDYAANEEVISAIFPPSPSPQVPFSPFLAINESKLTRLINSNSLSDKSFVLSSSSDSYSTLYSLSPEPLTLPKPYSCSFLHQNDADSGTMLDRSPVQEVDQLSSDPLDLG
ncbi:unnamed protein product [Protopolystoma xenopodis]|uniref:Uncharacterized protein n=1 Tax=Protopolystoma xenopodis TaxID=117903 RepID=A0A448XE30_9PLAT|nr:unnamed protein product [Protopolystoma xenopodis]